MTSCYLTIDDSPSPHTDAMIDFLGERKIQSLLFVRGDMIDRHGMESLIRAVKNSHVLGNHSFSHPRFGDLSYDESIVEIEKTDALINDVYACAGTKRTGNYFRFPYLDRGDGNPAERHFDNVADADINDDPRITKIQKYLHDNGYSQPFDQCTHPYYQNASIKNAADCLMTYSSFDWMMTNRHKGQWDYKTIDDLKAKIDGSDMKDYKGNITIFHDQDETFETFKSLIEHMVIRGYTFLNFQQHYNKRSEIK